MTKKSFAGAAALLFLASFFTINAYTTYGLKYSKVDKYKDSNNFHAQRVNAKIAMSFENISELKSLEKQSENFFLTKHDERAVVKEAIPVQFVVDVASPELERKQSERTTLNLEKAISSNDVVLPLFEINSNMALPLLEELNYALESNSKIKKMNYYAGLSFNGKLGFENYFNSNHAEKFTTAIFKEHTNSIVKSADESLVTGIGGQVFGGIMMNNGISIEAGISFSKMSGTSLYSIEHNYIREVERLEWVVTGEDDAEAVISKDYVESVAVDTVSSVFKRSLIQVPITINYSFDFGRIKPFVAAGASVNIVTSGNQSTNSSFQKISVDIEESTGINQLNLHAGIGVDIEISTNLNVRVKPALDLGVWNKNPEYMNGNLRDLSLQTGLYYKF